MRGRSLQWIFPILLAGLVPAEVQARTGQNAAQTAGQLSQEAARPGPLRVELLIGIEKARRGDESRAETILRRLEPRLTGEDRAAALRYLAFIAAHRGDLHQAADIGHGLLVDPAFSLRGADLDAFRQDVEAWSAFSAERRQTAGGGGVTDLDVEPGAAGRPEVRLRIDNHSVLALLDTGAEQTVVSASTASALNIRPLPTTLHDTGSTGAVNAVRLAVLPKMILGSFTLSNVPVEILGDDAMVVGSHGHEAKIDMIVGYPALRTLGSITMRKNRRITVGSTVRSGNTVITLLEDGFVPAIRSSIAGEPSELLLDTGSNSTILTKSSFDRSSGAISKLQRQNKAMSGIGGSAMRGIFVLPQVRLGFRKGSVDPSNVKLFSDPSQLDVLGLVGNIGRDLWADHEAVTIDFRRHEVRLR